MAASSKHGNVASASEECGELPDLETASFSRRFLPTGVSLLDYLFWILDP